MRSLLLLAAVFIVATAACAEASAPGVPNLSHVVVIVFENKETDEIVDNPEAPTFNSLARQGALLPHYAAVAHPSLPNYLALVSGSTQGLTRNCSDCIFRAPSLARSLAAAKRTWKTYAEGLPYPGFTGESAGLYVKRHNPFLYFRDVLAHPSRRRRVVPLTQLGADLAAHRLPQFALVVPDLCHGMHDCSVAVGDQWLAETLRGLLASSELRNGVVFVVFDEGRTLVGGGGRIAAYAVGPAVQPGARAGKDLTHYNLLATIEAAWKLPRLGESARARPMTGLWRRGN